MSGAMHWFALYAFTTWARKTIYFNDGISSSHYMAYNGKIPGT